MKMICKNETGMSFSGKASIMLRKFLETYSQ